MRLFYKSLTVMLTVVVTSCGTAALDKRKQALIDENNLSSENTISTFCSYYSLPKNSKISELETMHYSVCGIDTQTGNFFIKAFQDGASLDKRIDFIEVVNFGQSKYSLGGIVCGSVSFMCMPREQMVLESKSGKHIIEFHKKDTDDFVKVYRSLGKNEVTPNKIYTIHRPVVNVDVYVPK